MSRVKLTEYKSKQLLYCALHKKYHGVAVSLDESGTYSYSTPLSKLPSKERYAVKVDQGVKGRMKKGLVELNVHRSSLKKSIEKLARKGYSSFLIERMVPYTPDDERYLSIERAREGYMVRFAKVGGIDIEGMKGKVQEAVIHVSRHSERSKESRKKMDPSGKPQDDHTAQIIANHLGVDILFIQSLLHYCEKQYISFLEINPLVVQTSNIKRQQSTVHILDLAIEVDSTARFFVHNGWVEEDIVQDRHRSPEEQSIKQLNDNSQAALSFTLLNPNGSVWVLLSGGGASITLADEFYNLGHGRDLGNYGEYSGNPNAEETYLYTKEVLKALFKSKSKKKILLIGGGVANFTDVRITFQGILKAFEEYKKELKKQRVSVYVRRGGPMQKEGLAMMQSWLTAHDMCGYVAGPELPLYAIVRKVVDVL